MGLYPTHVFLDLKNMICRSENLCTTTVLIIMLFVTHLSKSCTPLQSGCSLWSYCDFIISLINFAAIVVTKTFATDAYEPVFSLEILQGAVFGQKFLADSCVYASGSLPTLGRGLIVFDRCETCDCTTGIPLSAADDRVSVL